MADELPHDELTRIVSYDPILGEFRWRVAISKKTVVGRVAGSINLDGYVCIGIYGRTYYAHRLAWFYMTEAWPTRGIDHADTNESNNAWANLRLATKSQNGANRSKPSTNLSGSKGVYWHKGAGKWCAMISKDGKNRYLGLFKNRRDAAMAYATAAAEMFGEFARN